MKQYITKHTIANEIRMHRSLFKGAFIVVEGPHDKRVYDKVVDLERCKFSIAFGVHTALGAIAILNADGFAGALAIIDSDFSQVGMPYPQHDNVILTDLHDVDCMLLNSPAFDSVLVEFADADRIEAIASRLSPLLAWEFAKIIAPLGCLQFMSLRDNLGLDFENLAFNKFVDSASLTLNITNMIREILNKSSRHDLDTVRLEGILRTELGKNHDCWHIVVGSHVIELLSFSLRRALASHSAIDVTPLHLRRCLRLAYEPAFLRQTKVYQQLLAWEMRNPSFAFLQAA